MVQVDLGVLVDRLRRRDKQSIQLLLQHLVLEVLVVLEDLLDLLNLALLLDLVGQALLELRQHLVIQLLIDQVVLVDQAHQ